MSVDGTHISDGTTRRHACHVRGQHWIYDEIRGVLIVKSRYAVSKKKTQKVPFQYT